MKTFAHPNPPTGLDDLLTRTGSGDQQAFAHLYDRGAATVHGLVLRVLRDPEAAEEVTRAVWIRVWHRSGQYTPAQGSALAWVIALTQRTVVERLRSSPSDTALTRIDSASTGPAGAEPDPNAYLSIATRRRAVLLAYYQGCTSEQISTVLGVPHETVATMIHSGLMHLRAHLRMADYRGPDVSSLNTAIDADRW
ncbi:sigma factor [Nocardiopsis valliformis]|uniref:sigma factor n=1 Tax=Nocardiopsis valliformis TaxID=239974 RepID=UPI000366F4F9|nr:sigma factor [Nocardiopsis valliformis]